MARTVFLIMLCIACNSVEVLNLHEPGHGAPFTHLSRCGKLTAWHVAPPARRCLEPATQKGLRLTHRCVQDGRPLGCSAVWTAVSVPSSVCTALQPSGPPSSWDTSWRRNEQQRHHLLCGRLRSYTSGEGSSFRYHPV